jgi:hypothetical protein
MSTKPMEKRAAIAARKKTWQKVLEEMKNPLVPLTKEERIRGIKRANAELFEILKDELSLNEIKIIADPMRTGKTYKSIEQLIPLMVASRVDLIIMTAPLNGIITQNLDHLKDVAHNRGYHVEDNLARILRLLGRGDRVITYLSNAGTYSLDSVGSKLLEKIDLDQVKVGTIVDEGDYGSISHRGLTNAAKGTPGPKFLATMYNFLKQICAKSPYTYLLTATPNYEQNGFITSADDCMFRVLKPRKKGEQNIYAGQVGWVGDAKFYDFGSNSIFNIGNKSVDDVLFDMSTSLVTIDTETGWKRSAMIQVSDNDEDYPAYLPVGHKDAKEAKEPVGVVMEIANNPKVKANFLRLANINEDTYIGAILSADEKYLFNLKGEVLDISKLSKVSDTLERLGFEIISGDIETIIYDAIDDQDNPLRLLMVKMMAGRGVTLRTVKEYMSFKMSETYSKGVEGTAEEWKSHILNPEELGHITESSIQTYGRAKSLYVVNGGKVVDNDEFWGEDIRGDLKNLPDFDYRINTANYYLGDSKKAEASFIKFLEYDACVPEMMADETAGFGSVPCPLCGCPSNGHCQNHEKVEDIEKYITPTVDRGNVIDELKIEGS